MSNSQKRTSDIRQQAADWVVRMRADISAELDAEFAAWAEQSEEHLKQFLIAATVYSHLATPVAERARVVVSSSPHRPDEDLKPSKQLVSPEQHVRLGSRGPSAPGQRLWIGAVAALVLGGLIALVLDMASPPPLQPVAESVLLTSGADAPRVDLLSDGSMVDLSAATQVRTRFTRTHRDAELLTGAAFFDVKHDPERPFIVSTAHATFEAVGTEFGVFQSDTGSKVIVRKGRVRVRGSCESRNGTAKNDMTVVENQEAVISSADCAISPISLQPEDLQKELSWRIIRFEGKTLEQAVDEMNRYNRRKMVIVDPSLKELRIGGSVDPHDVSTFTGSLRHFGVQVAPSATTDDDSSEISLVRNRSRSR
jgi:transmembrane sensor